MGKVIGFIKGNLVIVISVVLILAFLPTGYVFADKWNTKVREEADAAYKKEKRALTSKGTIEYSVPAVLTSERDLSESRAPNRIVTEYYLERKAEREAQVEEVVERGTLFNQGDHKELVPGILPKSPDDLTLKRLGRTMAEAIVGTTATPSVYQRKLQRLNAGSPPDPKILESILNEFKKNQEQRYMDADAAGKVGTAQAEELNKSLISRRLGEYIGQSDALTFYCSTNAFVNGGTKAPAGGRSGSNAMMEYSEIPASVPRVSSIDEPMVFNWLWDYWVISDILDAVSLTNTDPQSGAMAVPSAPIKSVERIRISQMKKTEDTTPGAAPRNAGAEPKQSLTGRIGGVAGSAYDIRTIEVVIVAASKDLPKFIDALGKTNYMTVIDLDIDDVDVWNDLEQGFYYGEDHVVRARVQIESVWLRSWMVPLMPDQVKQALGVPVAGAGFDG